MVPAFQNGMKLDVPYSESEVMLMILSFGRCGGRQSQDSRSITSDSDYGTSRVIPFWKAGTIPYKMGYQL